MGAYPLLKKLAAIIMLLAFSLPLSQCTTAKQAEPNSAFKEQTEVTYAYSAYSWPSAGAIVTYTAFLWPLALVIIGLIWPTINQKWITEVLELLLCAGSGFMLSVITYFGSLQYGAYIAWGAIAMYFIATSAQLSVRIWKFLNRI